MDAMACERRRLAIRRREDAGLEGVWMPIILAGNRPTRKSAQPQLIRSMHTTDALCGSPGTLVLALVGVLVTNIVHNGYVPGTDPHTPTLHSIPRIFVLGPKPLFFPLCIVIWARVSLSFLNRNCSMAAPPSPVPGHTSALPPSTPKPALADLAAFAHSSR